MSDYSDYRDEHFKKIQSKVLEKILKRIDPRTICDKPTHDFKRYAPNTTTLNKSDFAMMTKLSSGELLPKLRKKPSSVFNMLMNRQKGHFSSNTKSNISNRYIPNNFDILVGYDCIINTITFSKDGQHFITTSDDKFKMYNSGNGSYDIEKSMNLKHVQKYITDLECSPNNEHFVYSTHSLTLSLCKLVDGFNEEFPLVLDQKRSRSKILSVSFSAESRELLCSSSDGTVYIYDLESGRRTLKFLGHENNVNSVRFADDSGNIFYTAGYDTIVKLWDRRILSESPPIPVGYLAGHTKEITYMDLRGDGRHLITNSTDESIKLWDVRVLASAEVAEREVNEPRELKKDTSIMTYRGHRVRYAKMSCRFSPVETTGQRYIYTGCYSGRIVVYDALTGEAVQPEVGHDSYVCCVLWHPTRNEMLSSGLDGLVGIWTYMDPNNIMEPEQIERDRKHFSSYKFHNGLLLDPVRRCNR